VAGGVRDFGFHIAIFTMPNVLGLDRTGLFYNEPGLSAGVYSARDNTGRSVLTDAQLPTRRPDGGGKYELWLGLFQLALEKQL